MDMIVFVVIAMIASTASFSAVSDESKCYGKGLVYSGIDDRCHKLATQGPCEDDSWLVISTSNYFPSCSLRPCPDQEAFYNGSCIHVYSPEVCPRLGEALIHNAFGKARCGCKDGWGQYRGECGQEFTRGKCTGGRVLVRGDSVTNRQKRFVHPDQINSIKKLMSSLSVNLECLRNSCGDSKEKLMWTDGQCHKVEGDVKDCEVELRRGNLACVPKIVPFSIGPGPHSKQNPCRPGRVWNKYRRKCIRAFRGR